MASACTKRLKTCKARIEPGRPTRTDLLSCTAKAVKSVLLFHKIDFPFTHDLEELLDTLEVAGLSVPAGISDIGVLTPYAVETRYPGYWGEITEDDVSEAVSFAEKAIQWAEKIIKER